jgi:hypothetical protein
MAIFNNTLNREVGREVMNGAEFEGHHPVSLVFTRHRIDQRGGIENLDEARRMRGPRSVESRHKAIQA